MTLPIPEREFLPLAALDDLPGLDEPRDVTANDIGDAIDLGAREMVEVMAGLVGRHPIIEKCQSDAFPADIYTFERLFLTNHGEGLRLWRLGR